jgi:DNA-binding MarR family transcriptional regulator
LGDDSARGDTDVLADRVHAVAIRLLRHARVADAASGVSAARLSVLSVLVYAGDRTVTELAAAEQVATPTMTRLLQAMEDAGHVRRARDAEDGRVVRVTATARGRRVLERAREARLRRLAAVLNRVSRADRRRLASAVAALEAALRD